MHRIILFLMIVSSVWANAQTEDSLLAEISVFQKELNDHYKDKETSPLKKKERKHFEGHRFFDVDLTYRVMAEFYVLSNPDTVVMPTSAGTEKTYLRYAELHFMVNGLECTLIAYQSTKVGYQNYLFVPFRDGTTGTDSYGGGRYIDLEMPKGDSIVLNFNLAYNPYCAYTTGWFCPLPPTENTLNVNIKAGLMVPNEH